MIIYPPKKFVKEKKKNIRKIARTAAPAGVLLLSGAWTGGRKQK
jgi:hypothetical protein